MESIISNNQMNIYVWDPNTLKTLLSDNQEEKLRKSLERLGQPTEGGKEQLLDRFWTFLSTRIGKEKAYNSNISK
jgi:hypothetical protein